MHHLGWMPNHWKKKGRIWKEKKSVRGKQRKSDRRDLIAALETGDGRGHTVELGASSGALEGR